MKFIMAKLPAKKHTSHDNLNYNQFQKNYQAILPGITDSETKSMGYNQPCQGNVSGTQLPQQNKSHDFSVFINKYRNITFWCLQKR